MKKGLILVGILAFMVQCSNVPITDRKQLNLLPTSQLRSMSFSQYQQVKNETPPLPNTDARAQMIKKVGKKLSEAANSYMSKNGMKDRISDFEWEFNIIDDPTINAWCMPGGKVMFYTGILPICEKEEGVATVMGHEIAHAIANHGNERMSHALAVQAGGVALSVLLQDKPQEAQELFLTSFGVGSQLGILKYSRLHESEADKMGLVFMAMAGYDPGAAVDFWKRMAALGGANVPEFMSTHPSDARRVKDIQDFLPEARKYMN